MAEFTSPLPAMGEPLTIGMLLYPEFTLLDLAGPQTTCCEQTAKKAQLMMEYDPQPPFDTGSPKAAGPELVQAVLDLGMADADLIDVTRDRSLRPVAHPAVSGL